jgi:hypothetical protein
MPQLYKLPAHGDAEAIARANEPIEDPWPRCLFF